MLTVCADVGLRSSRKRAIVDMAGGEASSPTKCRRLNNLGAELDETNESAGIDFPPTAESDGTEYSRFRHYGALASTSENNTYSETSVSPVSVRTAHSPRLPSQKLAADTIPSTGDPAGHDCGFAGKWARTPQAPVTRHGMKRKRSIDEYDLSGQRASVKPRLATQRREDKATVEDLDEPSSEGSRSLSGEPGHFGHRQRTPDADQPVVAEPNEADHAEDDSNLSDQVRSEAQLLAEELEREGQEIWAGEHPSIMLSSGFCKPRDLRILATDGRLTDKFLNTVPVLGQCKDTDRYLLPTFIVRLINDARYKDLDRWTTSIPKQSKHRQMLERVEKWAKHRYGEQTVWRLDSFPGPVQAVNDHVNCGAYVTWVLRRWVRGEDPSPTGLTHPLAFTVEILKWLRLCSRVPVLPSVDEDKALSDITQMGKHSSKVLLTGC
ncbi:hypothetical protein LTR33_000282 [Friedmanniomyces endolithicus]|nr:hypothetical protein LTR33_000282 [Friedmanniomyces endolithicus]